MNLPSLTPLDKAMLSLSTAYPPTGHDPALDTPAQPWHHYSHPTPGQLIRAAMKRLNLTQRDMAIRLGVHYVTLNRLVQGLNRGMNTDSRWKLETLCQPYPELRTMYRLVDWPYSSAYHRRRD